MKRATKHTTIRVSDAIHGKLKARARREKSTMQAVLEEAIDQLERQRFLEEVNRGYAALRADSTRWGEVAAERAAWDLTLEDGLPDERWTHVGTPAASPGRKPHGRSRAR